METQGRRAEEAAAEKQGAGAEARAAAARIPRESSPAGSEALGPLGRAIRRGRPKRAGEPAGGRALPAEPQPWPRPLGAALLRLLSAQQSSLPATLQIVTP